MPLDLDPPPEASGDAMTAAIVLSPDETSRNRNFALYAGEVGEEARRRARRVRGMVRQVTGSFGPAQLLELTPSDDGRWRVRYRLRKIALERTILLTASDLAVMRVAIARTGARLLPAALVAREDDHARVAALLEHFSRVRAQG